MNKSEEDRPQLFERRTPPEPREPHQRETAILIGGVLFMITVIIAAVIIKMANGGS